MKKLRRHQETKHLNRTLVFSFGLLFLFLLVSFLKDRFTGSEMTPKIRGAIVTHHEVAQELMIDLGKKISNQGRVLSNIIIVGPNHDELGGGNLLSDDELLVYKSEKLITHDEVVVNRDHACFAPRSVLQKYLPNTKISCILVSSRTREEEIKKIVEILKSSLGEDGVLVASVDFSHYLPLRDALEKDSITWKYIEEFDVEALQKLNNDHLDSPKTMAILFEYLKNIGAMNFSKVKHVNSAQILGTLDSSSTTSYFEVIYW
ncbi:MAG TPA: AmmeMemoRadiSam system protein B [Candidatus Methanoperedens sp.]|nr:AmmeMemoRadiSam system protein B [Candidatus Methanoperedens sp.]